MNRFEEVRVDGNWKLLFCILPRFMLCRFPRRGLIPRRTLMSRLEKSVQQKGLA